MSNNHATDADREAIRRFRFSSGDCALCLKRYAAEGEKTRIMGYAAYGVITNVSLPIVIFLRGDTPAEDFSETVSYETLDAMFDAGWVVD